MQFDPEKITFFGRTDARGKNVAFGIKAKDRQRHVYVIGKTGMGKSTLLENMAVQDIQNGEGMAFIDPHGSAAETLLSYIPEHRVKDILYFAPADAAYPVSFNIMEDVGPDKRHLVVSGLMSVFKKIWVDAWSARMEYILQNTILALLEYPGSTLIGVNRMLSDKVYRDMIVKNVKDPGVRSFWVDEFAKYNERYMQEAGDAIKNKIGQFTANPIIRNIIGQPKSSFDIRKMMDEKKIIIMNLSKGLIGETNANLLGSMLTTRIYLAAMSRADISPEKMKAMPNFYFYVDEFQSFANATFANILSEARKYHLNLTIAHQYIEQMEEEVRNAVFGNVGTIVSFRVGPFDAEVLETIFTPQFLAADIVNLGFAQVYLTLMIDGIGSPPFSATTLPPIAPQSISYKDMVIASSREQFARLRADVEADIEKFHEPIIVVKPPRPAAAPVSVSEVKVDQRDITEPKTSTPLEARRDGEKNRDTDRRMGERRDLNQKRDGERSGGRTDVRSGERQSSRSQEKTHERAPERNRDRAPQHALQHTGERTPTHSADGEKPRTQISDEAPKVLRKIETGNKKPIHAPSGGNERLPESGKKNKDEHLNELRAALQKIAQEEKSVTPPKALTPQPLPETRPVQSNHVEVTTPKAHEADTQKVPLGGRGDTAQQKVEEGRRVVTEDREGSVQSGVSPKELERMMRITTSDKPPY